jgi:hypothetical protein
MVLQPFFFRARRVIMTLYVPFFPRYMVIMTMYVPKEE